MEQIPAGSQYDALREKLERLQDENPEAFAQISAARILGWIADIDSGQRTAEKIVEDIDEFIVSPLAVDSTTEAKTPKEEEQDKEGIGENPDEGDTDLTLLTGKEVKWFFDRSTGKWYVSYGLPNSDRSVIFEASPEQMDSLFGEGRRPIDWESKTFNEILQDNATFAGNISEMEGTGSFEGHVERVTALALDEGRLPEWAKADNAVMDLLFIAQAENKSDEWLLEQISELDSFKARFPDIKAFQAESNLTLGEAITGFLEMEAGVRTALKGAGFDADSVTPEIIGALLVGGHSLDIVNQTVAGFKRMKDFAPALEAFNAILESQGFDPITSLDDMLNFVSGQAGQDVYDIWEASSLQEAAISAGLGDLFSAEDAMASALSGNHTLQSATDAMQQAANLLLRLRHEVDTEKFGLTTEELLDISLGQAPRSGRSSAEVNDSINRAVATAQASLKKRSQAFTSFDNTGVPQASSLGRARQEQ